MLKTPKVLLLLGLISMGASTALSVPAAQASQAELRADHRPAFTRFVSSQGPAYGLSQDLQGKTFLTRNDLRTGQPAKQPVTGPTLSKLMSFIGGIQSGSYDEAMTRALRLYLDGREAKDLAFESTLFAGPAKLTALGRSVLMDILTAEDGKLFKDEEESIWSRLKGKAARGGVTPPSAKLPRAPTSLDESGLDAYYDGSAPGSLSAFDWSKMGSAPTVTANSGLQNYAIDREKGVVRVMVAAHQNVRTDRYENVTAADSRKIFAEAGLDAKLFAANGAKVVRAVDNLVTVEVPLPKASRLGLALQQDGVTSRPARVFRTTAAAIQSAPGGWLAPTLQFLPLPLGFTHAQSVAYDDKNADAERILGLKGLWGKGMTGKNAIVGVLDSGIDPNHPDFKGRVLEYVDMTPEANNKDGFGHGTHVAGGVGGSGAASNGMFKGAAPDTKFVVYKVFDKDGNTTEDTILAAMKRAASLPADKRPQVINMSLGGPGDPDKDPMARLANRIMLKNNILLVAAAGNSGPTDGTVGSPGNAQYVMTVTGVNRQGEFPFFTSRGPIVRREGEDYGKPDISGVAGDVNLGALRRTDGIQTIGGLLSASTPLSTGAGEADSNSQHCVYGPGGVIADRSSDDADTACMVPGHPQYRYMSGTSMAAPLVAGAAADVIGYLREKGVDYRATEIKAAMMETAHNLKKPTEMQGAGLMSGEKLASTVIARVSAGVPIGNIAYMLSMRLTSEQRETLDKSARFRATPLGIVDTKNGRLIKTDEELFWLIHEMKGPINVAYRRKEQERHHA